MLEVVNDLYSSEVAQRAGDHGVEVTADYALRQGAIPVPATLLTELLERISRSDSGMRGRHYSEYPFKTRVDGGPRDEFEWEALAHLKRYPDEPYVRFVRDEDGGTVLRRATARRMQQSCVDCHNHHPDSIKTDWKVGDVRGVLEIVRPLTGDEESVRSGLRGSFVLVGVVSALLLGLTGSALVIGGKRRRSRIAKGGAQ
jgi:adenylate cyclase